MKKLAIAALVAATLSTSAMAFDVQPYVGVERATEANTNAGVVGATTQHGMFTVMTEATFIDGENDHFDGRLYEIDVNAAVTNNIDVYMENDFTNDMEHVETWVGAKYKF